MRSPLILILALLVLNTTYAQTKQTVSSMEITPYHWKLPDGLSEKSAILPSKTPDLPSFNEIDLGFNESSVTQFNQFGSFGYFNNGFTDRVKTGHYRFFFNDYYQNFSGYRDHSSIYGTSINSGLQVVPSQYSKVEIMGYYLKGEAKLPGGLNKAEFDATPFNANPRSLHRDEKRAVVRGRSDVRYSATFGKSHNNEIMVQGWGSFDNINRATEEYKVISKSGYGFKTVFTNQSTWRNHQNIVNSGLELSYLPVNTEYYENFAGAKGLLEKISSEKVRNNSFYISDQFEILKKKLFVKVTGRYDRENYHVQEEIQSSRAETKIFEAFTPNMELTYQPLKWLNLYGIYGIFYRAPTEKELESSYGSLYNDMLQAQSSRNFEIGAKADWENNKSTWFKNVHIEFSLFHYVIDNELVSFEVDLEEFCRNSPRTHQTGTNFTGRIGLLKDLVFNFNWKYSDFLYKTYVANVFVPTGFETRDFSGNAEPDVPVNKILLGLSFHHTFSGKITLISKADYTSMSKRWVDDDNSAKTDPVNLFNFMAGLSMDFGRFHVSASGGVNNIFNSLYVDKMTINSYEYGFYNAGSPRDYFCSLNFAYNF